jgi:hypothetical protein
MGPWFSCRKDDLLGVDLTSLGLPPPYQWLKSSDSYYWPHRRFPLASLPRDKV